MLVRASLLGLLFLTSVLSVLSQPTEPTAIQPDSFASNNRLIIVKKASLLPTAAALKDGALFQKLKDAAGAVSSKATGAAAAADPAAAGLDASALDLSSEEFLNVLQTSLFEEILGLSSSADSVANSTPAPASAAPTTAPATTAPSSNAADTTSAAAAPDQQTDPAGGTAAAAAAAVDTAAAGGAAAVPFDTDAAAAANEEIAAAMTTDGVEFVPPPMRRRLQDLAAPVALGAPAGAVGVGGDAFMTAAPTDAPVTETAVTDAYMMESATTMAADGLTFANADALQPVSAPPVSPANRLNANALRAGVPTLLSAGGVSAREKLSSAILALSVHTTGTINKVQDALPIQDGIVDGILSTADTIQQDVFQAFADMILNIYNLPLLTACVVEVKDTASLEQIETQLPQIDNTLAVFRDVWVTGAQTRPAVSDPYQSYQWGLASKKCANCDINAPEAWTSLQSFESKYQVSVTYRPIIAILDSGIDVTHPDLYNNLWRNPQEALQSASEKLPSPETAFLGDGVDNDQDGFVDDIFGWNFVSNSNNVTDDHFHGTMMAGIASAVSNNNVGISGVGGGRNPLIMPLKFLGSDGNGYLSDALRAMQYARQHGADVISASFGCPADKCPYSNTILQAIQQTDSLHVYAAGNFHSNNDVLPFYPASYNSDGNVISVAGTSEDGSLGDYSNFGAASVHMAAPGTSILSTCPRAKYPSGYCSASGTSFAVPFVAGSAGLLKSIFPPLRWPQLKAILTTMSKDPLASATATGTPTTAVSSVKRQLKGNVVHGLLDLQASVGILLQAIDRQITSMAASTTTTTTTLPATRPPTMAPILVRTAAPPPGYVVGQPARGQQRTGVAGGATVPLQQQTTFGQTPVTNTQQQQRPVVPAVSGGTAATAPTTTGGLQSVFQRLKAQQQTQTASQPASGNAYTNPNAYTNNAPQLAVQAEAGQQPQPIGVANQVATADVNAPPANTYDPDLYLATAAGAAGGEGGADGAMQAQSVGVYSADTDAYETAATPDNAQPAAADKPAVAVGELVEPAVPVEDVVPQQQETAQQTQEVSVPPQLNNLLASARPFDLSTYNFQQP